MDVALCIKGEEKGNAKQAKNIGYFELKHFYTLHYACIHGSAQLESH